MPLDRVDLTKYLSDVFIETGTHRGDGVRRALEAGFSEVYSMEPNISMLSRMPQGLLDDHRVMVGVGDSRKWLCDFIYMAENDSVTFWLDAHPDGELSFDDSPLADELRHIKTCRNLYISTTILIDDMRLFSDEDQARIEAVVRSMGDDPQVYRINGHCENDILVGQM